MPTPAEREFIASRVRQAARIETKDELVPRFNAAIEGIQQLQIFPYWFDGVIPSLKEALRERVPTEGPIDVQQDPLDARIRVWNLFGSIAIGEGQAVLAEDLFSVLLSELRTLQPDHGRVHKGTPYHQVAWAKMVAGDPGGAKEYFTYAAIEDLIETGIPEEVPVTPATQTLAIQYGTTPQALRQLVTLVQRAALDDTSVGRLKVQNPEILLMDERVSLAEIADRVEVPDRSKET
jgi:hypothetical protein